MSAEHHAADMPGNAGGLFPGGAMHRGDAHPGGNHQHQVQPALPRQAGGRRGEGDEQTKGFAPGPALAETEGQQAQRPVQCAAVVKPPPGGVFDHMGVEVKAAGVNDGLFGGGNETTKVSVFNFFDHGTCPPFQGAK